MPDPARAIPARAIGSLTFPPPFTGAWAAEHAALMLEKLQKIAKLRMR